MSKMFNLDGNDFVKGLFSAVVAAVVCAVWPPFQTIVQTPGFDVFAVQWGVVLGEMLNIAINAAVAAFVGYMGKNFLSDSQGRPLGMGKARN